MCKKRRLSTKTQEFRESELRGHGVLRSSALALSLFYIIRVKNRSYGWYVYLGGASVVPARSDKWSNDPGEVRHRQRRRGPDVRNTANSHFIFFVS